MANHIDPTYYAKFRQRGYGAREAARLAIGWRALQTGLVQEIAQAKARQAAELAPTPAGWMAL